jgi:DNA-binding MarR family transcriptional regulator
MAEEVLDSLMAVARVLIALTAKSLADLDANVTLPQFRALIILAGAQPRRIVDLAAELGVRSSTATRMCDRLMQKGLVTRREHAADRRVAWVVLTPQGRDLVTEIMRRRREQLGALLGRIDVPDPRGLAAALAALAAAAGEPSERQWQHGRLLPG